VDFIIENRSQWVGKNRGRFLEGYSMFLLIGSGFRLIPLKLQAHGAPHLTDRDEVVVVHQRVDQVAAGTPRRIGTALS
jgi:hypothetical protein